MFRRDVVRNLTRILSLRVRVCVWSEHKVSRFEPTRILRSPYLDVRPILRPLQSNHIGLLVPAITQCERSMAMSLSETPFAPRSSTFMAKGELMCSTVNVGHGAWRFILVALLSLSGRRAAKKVHKNGDGFAEGIPNIAPHLQTLRLRFQPTSRPIRRYM